MIDGTGSPARAVDVVVEGPYVVAVTAPGDAGPVDRTIDLDGLVLAPGFVDPHTHYDAQVLWDRDLTPSSQHGVTTVVVGNCGFGIAPTRPSGRRDIARTLQHVEGMTLDALLAGIPWTFETFPEYLDAIEAQPTRLNVGALIGHTPLRLHTLGSEAPERAATHDEVATMRAAVVDAMHAGALGFATSVLPVHVGADGKPVPSRLASEAEITSLVDAVRSTGRGVVQVALGPGPWFDFFGRIARDQGVTVTWTGLVPGLVVPGSDEAWTLLDHQAEFGPRMSAQISCRPVTVQFDLADPALFASVPAFGAVRAAAPSDRAAFYRDPAWREQARADLDTVHGHRWAKTTVAESVRHSALVGAGSLATLAAAREVHAVDALLDLALSDDLATKFSIVVGNDDEALLAQLLGDDRTLLALSDAGAHASQLCDACYSTHLLGHWVRETETLTLEHAVWRLTGHPAAVFGLPDRGRIEPGAVADLVAFDPDRVGHTAARRVWDLPAGADRLVVDSVGVEHVWVNGVAIRTDGFDLEGVRPGRLLRAPTAPAA